MVVLFMLVSGVLVTCNFYFSTDERNEHVFHSLSTQYGHLPRNIIAANSICVCWISSTTVS